MRPSESMISPNGKDMRASSVARASAYTDPASENINTLERAAERNMYGKYPAPVEPEPIHISFLDKHRASEPAVTRARLPPISKEP